jgi:NADH dehydrogenase
VSNKKIVVSGASGFLGKRVIHFLNKEKYEIYCLVRDLRCKKGMPKSSNIQYILLSDVDHKKNCLKDAYAFIHLAAETKSPNRKKNYDSNVLLTKRFVNLCKENNIKKVIFTSSINTRFKRGGIYGKTKLEAEKLIKESGLDYVIFVPPTIYGINDRGLSKTISLVRKLPIIPVIGKGTAKMQPVFVDDVACAIVRSIKSKIKRKTYYLGGKESFTFDDLLSMIMNRLHIKKKRFHIPFFLIFYPTKIASFFLDRLPVNPEQILSVTQDKNGDIRKAVKDLKYNPISFKKGFGIMMDDKK